MKNGTKIETNGKVSNGKLPSYRIIPTTDFWNKIHVNEFTFSLSLFLFSLSIVISKVYLNYGKIPKWSSNKYFTEPAVSTIYYLYNKLKMDNILNLYSTSTKNIMDSGDVITNKNSIYENIIIFYDKIRWLIKALIYGIIAMSFSWFVIYKDSRIPGEDPPFPFKLSKSRFHSAQKFHFSYLVGILFGILIFVHMCL